MLSIWTRLYFCQLVRVNAQMIAIYWLPNPFLKDDFKLKAFAEDNFIFVEKGKGFCKRVENTVAKGDTAHHEQFLLFPQYFQKTSTADM